MIATSSGAVLALRQAYPRTVLVQERGSLSSPTPAVVELPPSDCRGSKTGAGAAPEEGCAGVGNAGICPPSGDGAAVKVEASGRARSPALLPAWAPPSAGCRTTLADDAAGAPGSIRRSKHRYAPVISLQKRSCDHMRANARGKGPASIPDSRLSRLAEDRSGADPSLSRFQLPTRKFARVGNHGKTWMAATIPGSGEVTPSPLERAPVDRLTRRPCGEPTCSQMPTGANPLPRNHLAHDSGKCECLPRQNGDCMMWRAWPRPWTLDTRRARRPDPGHRDS
jgi:hypothetical protein